MDETYALLMQEGFLMDVALIYTLLSFLTVMLLCRIFIGSYRQRHEKEAEQNG